MPQQRSNSVSSTSGIGSSSNSPFMGCVPSPSSVLSAFREEEDFFNIELMENNLDDPTIVIMDQPVDKFRFRYKSEMMGTHGSLASANAITKRKRQAPAVKLLNYPSEAIIRCSIVTKDENKRMPHAHHLVKREGNNETDQPYEIIVSKANDWTATFHGMGIIHTAKKNIRDELVNKMRAEKIEKYQQEGHNISNLSVRDETQIKMDAERAQKTMDLNSVALCFQAFVINNCGIKMPLTKPVYSTTINNLKSALTGELKICRIDKIVSSCEGGDEIFLLVEKVGKKNIKVKFFELDDNDHEIWCDYGRFSELDVHHQYAIVFTTPPYRDREITSSKDVFLQLLRPSDGDCSEAIQFTYKPSEHIRRKRPRVMSYSDNIDLANTITPETLMTNNIFTIPSKEISSDLSIEIKKLLTEKCSSHELRECLENIDLESCINLLDPIANDDNQLCFDGIKTKAEKIKPDKLIKSVKEILNKRSSDGDTPLHLAIVNNEHQTLEDILRIINSSEELTSILNLQNASGKTPLHYAVILNQPDVVNRLLSLGADPNIKDNNGMNPLHEAVKRPEAESIRCVDLLLKKKCNYDTPDDAGWSALQLAAKTGFVNCVDLLVKAGADVNSVERSCGRTALQISAECGHLDVARYLLENTSVKVNQRNLSGNTALHAAKAYTGSRGSELIRLLLQHGADPDTSSIQLDVNLKDDEIKRVVDDCEEKLTSIELTIDNNEMKSLLIIEGSQQDINNELVENNPSKIVKTEDTSEWLDTDKMTQLGIILERDDGWKDLAKNLGCDYLLSSLETSNSHPALSVLNYADVQGDITLSKLFEILRKLKQTEAAKFVENIMKNREI